LIVGFCPPGPRAMLSFKGLLPVSIGLLVTDPLGDDLGE
jgi:hypothetical protein